MGFLIHGIFNTWSVRVGVRVGGKGGEGPRPRPRDQGVLALGDLAAA